MVGPHGGRSGRAEDGRAQGTLGLSRNARRDRVTLGVGDGRYRGWIDVVAFDRRTGHLLVIEIKTTIDDVGAIERQIGWYERLAATVAGDHGWRPRKVSSWLLVLASEQVDQALARQRDVFDAAFPVRSGALRAMLTDGVGPGRGLAMIDPARRRSDWLLPTRLDGRRTAAPYADSAAALRKLGLSPIVPMSRPVTRAG